MFEDTICPQSSCQLSSSSAEAGYSVPVRFFSKVGVEIIWLYETGHEWMQKPPSGGKRNSTTRVENHIPRVETGESLVETGGTRAACVRTGTHRHHRVGARLQGAVRSGVLLFPFGSPILKPDFHLGFGQAQGQSQVESLTHGQVPSCAELVFQRHQLLVGERSSGASWFGTGLVCAPTLGR